MTQADGAVQKLGFGCGLL